MVVIIGEGSMILNLIPTQEEIIDSSLVSFWAFPQPEIRLRALPNSEIVLEGPVRFSCASGTSVRHVFLTRLMIGYSTVRLTQNSLDKRIRRTADITRMSAEAFEQTGTDFCYGIHLAYSANQFQDFYFDEEPECQKWMQALSFVCKTNDFKGEYRILYKIGAGGFGSVFVAQELQSDTLVTVKIMPQDKKEVIENEINILKNLQVSNASRLIKVFEDTKQVYLVMKFAPGINLSAYLYHQRKLKEWFVRQIMTQLLKIVRDVHHSGVTHNDLKPENIIINFAKCKLSLTLIDFGLSSLSSKSYKGKCCGTLGYMAPEVIRRRESDQKSDVFSLGIIAYTLIAGENPFKSSKTQRVAVLNKRCKLSFAGKRWEKVSKACKEFITLLTSADAMLRPTVDEALTHVWLSSFAGEMKKSPALPHELSSVSTESRGTIESLD